MYQNKFNIGDKVLVTEGKHADTAGVVIAIREHEIDESAEQGKVFSIPTFNYRYIVMPENAEKSISIRESQLELVLKIKMEVDAQLFKKSLEMDNSTPKFKVGDVVIINHCNPDRSYAIQESIDIGCRGMERFVYELTAVDSEDEHHQCYESALEFLWHDQLSEYYCTEGARNGLPAWRGKIYNLFMFYDEMNYDTRINEILCDDYNNDTIPPKCMKHILKGHSLLGRIDDVVSEHRDELMKLLGIELIDDLLGQKESIKSKLRLMNRTGASQSIRETIKGEATEFSKREKSLINAVDSLDRVKGEIQGHYPAIMTNLQIMEAIKEAYSTAVKTGSRDMHIERDKRNPERGTVTPIKGVAEYEGISETYNNLRIRFYYSFDLNFIDTAFPVTISRNSTRKNTNVEQVEVIKESAKDI